MKIEYTISILAYVAALILGGYYLYLLIPLYAFMFKDKWLEYLKRNVLKHALLWGLLGGGAAILLQNVWGNIQKYLFKIQLHSTHTNNLVSSAKTGVGMILLICVICPILEEIIFRKIIFEAFKKKCGIIAASIISAIFFSLIHFDFSNAITYILIGLAFSVIYTKTKSLLNSMAAHMVMNTIILTIFWTNIFYQ